MRGIEIPKFRAVSSGAHTLDELFGNGESFHNTWFLSHRHLLKEHIYEPQDFVWHEDGDINKSVWILAINENVTESDVAPYEIIDFPGGIFLVATADESDSDDLNETVSCMMSWIQSSAVFEYGDFPKSGMSNMPNPDGAFDKALGVAQQQIYLPLKFRDSQSNVK
ncbi:hypothetical protein FACS1894191_1850 [Clostridia bacterium]|nr:hypothetical protein FACS1894191_1850 [Clostridia bacterium]